MRRLRSTKMKSSATNRISRAVSCSTQRDSRIFARKINSSYRARSYRMSCSATFANQSRRELQFKITQDRKQQLSLELEEFEFNLTHSGDIVLYGVAHSRHVGVDVERIKEIPRAVELAKRFMSAGEHEKIASASTETRDRDFLSLWVRREGSGKAYGVGVWKVLENRGREPAQIVFAEIPHKYVAIRSSCASISMSLPSQRSEMIGGSFRHGGRTAGAVRLLSFAKCR